MKTWIHIIRAAGAVGLLLILAAPGDVAAQEGGQMTEAGKRVAVLGEVSHSAMRADGTPKDRGDFEPHPATQHASRLVTTADLTEWAKEMMADNWGRWGPEDTRGALNLITPEKTVEAARLVQAGVTVPLGAWMGLNGFRYELDTWRRVGGRHWMTVRDWMGNPEPSSAIAFGTHDGVVSHMDAICHYPGSSVDPSRRAEGDEASVVYNGYPFVMSAETGCPKMGIDEMGLEYATRGVLYDMVYLKGGPEADWNDPTLPIFIEDLEEWERFSGASVGRGDAMIVYNGRYAIREAEGAWHYDGGNSGLHASVLPWIHERDIAVLIGDGPNDVQPSGVEGMGRPVHQMMMTVMGRPIVDNGYPDEAARIARELDRWEFMVAWRNLDIPGGSASPFNAVAIF